LFSEYVEGSSFNKALEIYNAGSVAIDLTGCSIQNYANGATTPAASYALTDVLAPGATLVVCNASAGTTLMPLCNRLVAGTALNFNGDDAIALSCDGALVDVIGQIGFDPGTEWGSGNTSTADNTIRRLCTVTTGRTNGMDAFVPATEWSGFATDVFDGLGSRGCP
jgi:predicted extracellular nuclease